MAYDQYCGNTLTNSTQVFLIKAYHGQLKVGLRYYLCNNINVGNFIR